MELLNLWKLLSDKGDGASFVCGPLEIFGMEADPGKDQALIRNSGLSAPRLSLQGGQQAGD